MANKSLNEIYNLKDERGHGLRHFVPVSSNFTKITILGYKVDKLELGYWDFGKGPCTYINLYLGGGKVKLNLHTDDIHKLVSINLDISKVDFIVKRLKTKIKYSGVDPLDGNSGYIVCSGDLMDEIINLLSESKALWKEVSNY